MVKPTRNALKKPVGAVIAAIDILRCLGEADESLRLSDIVKALSLNSSTALNILRTLENENLINFDRRSKLYTLANGLSDLAMPLLVQQDVERQLEHLMQVAAQELRATVLLWKPVGEHVELLAAAESSESIRLTFTVGRRLPLFMGAVGRIIASRANYAAPLMVSLFAKAPWARQPDYKTWLQEVAKASVSGVAVDRGYLILGVLGVAVPVELTGCVKHVISAAAFERPGNERQEFEILDHLDRLANLARTGSFHKVAVASLNIQASTAELSAKERQSGGA